MSSARVPALSAGDWPETMPSRFSRGARTTVKRKASRRPLSGRLPEGAKDRRGASCRRSGQMLEERSFPNCAGNHRYPGPGPERWPPPGDGLKRLDTADLRFRRHRTLVTPLPASAGGGQRIANLRACLDGERLAGTTPAFGIPELGPPRPARPPGKPSPLPPTVWTIRPQRLIENFREPCVPSWRPRADAFGDRDSTAEIVAQLLTHHLRPYR